MLTVPVFLTLHYKAFYYYFCCVPCFDVLYFVTVVALDFPIGAKMLLPGGKSGRIPKHLMYRLLMLVFIINTGLSFDVSALLSISFASVHKCF